MIFPKTGEIWYMKHNKQYHFVIKNENNVVHTYDMYSPKGTFHTDISFWDVLFQKIQ